MPIPKSKPLLLHNNLYHKITFLLHPFCLLHLRHMLEE
jgi:hypothetical protein